MLYFTHYMTDLKFYFHCSVLSHFDLLSIFMVMINIKKIELISTTESCLSNDFFFCLEFLFADLIMAYPLNSNTIFHFVEYERTESCFISKFLQLEKN